jgi:pimeloyl-ACP methyl ester carboxylesterase
VSWQTREAEERVGPLGLSVLDARRAGADGSGRTVLMLHGIGSHGASWRPVLDHLTGVDRVVCPDLRGHGRSDWSRDGYWLHDYATDARLLVDRLGIDQVCLVGHSLGAQVAMLLAPMLGGRLAGAVLMDTGPDPRGLRPGPDAGRPLHGRPGFTTEDELKESLRAKHPYFDDEQLAIRARSLYRMNWAGLLIPRTDPEVFWLLDAPGGREVDDVWSALRAVEAPVLVLRAAGRSQLDAETAGRMVRALPDGRLAEVELGHHLHYEDPVRTAAVLDAFHADLDAGRTRTGAPR